MHKSNVESIGELFGSIQYKSDDDLNNLLENLNDVQALYFLNLALEISKSQNIFSLVELEILSKSFRIIKKENSNDRKDKV